MGTIDLGLPGVNANSHEANRRTLRDINVRIIDVSKSKDGSPEQSNVLPPEDPFSGLIGSNLVIEPPFDMLTLATLSEHSGELGQCIEAMEVNIDGTGHRFVSRLKVDAAGKPIGGGKVEGASVAEMVRLTNFFTYCTTEPFTAWRRKLRKDLEHTGNCYYEVLKDEKTGHPISFTHIPSYQMRLGMVSDDAYLIDRPIVELQVDGSVKAAKRPEWRRFRKFVQCRTLVYGSTRGSAGGARMRWFKEWLDPRRIDADTGEEIPKGAELKPGQRLATEVYHSKLYSSRSPYGLPRFIGNLISIYGDRAAEEINYITFRNNNIPSMVFMLSNGQMTEASIERLKQFAESNIQGSSNISKFVIVEAEPFQNDSGEDAGAAKIDIKPLTKDQRTDELFSNYREKNADRIRRAYRLPPVFVGVSQDYSYATIQASRSLGDEQVFAPERTPFDDHMNRDILPSMGIIYHLFRSNTPNTTDNVALVKIVAAAEKTGGMTPRIARQALEEILGTTLPAFPEGFPSDVPFSLTMAEAVKNKADPAEPGQQVTALKALGILGDNMELLIDENEDNVSIAKKLVSLQGTVEELWRRQVA
jgi:PBSX family phage portal protein